MIKLETLYAQLMKSAGACTDTRKLVPGQIFFALRGPNFDGNAFAHKALAAGASAAVVDAEEFKFPRDQKLDERLIVVVDVLGMLQALAHYHREQMNLLVLGLTGSNGKTTTKNLIAAVLSRRFRVFATPGNLNNHIGLPLSLLQVQPEHQIAVLEMGDNQREDIAALCNISEPDMGLITNIGRDHIGNYRDQQENVAAKLELFDFIRDIQQGVLFVNLADPWLAQYRTGKADVAGYGNAERELHANILRSDLSGLEVEILRPNAPIARVRSRLWGAFNAENILAAFRVGLFFEIPPAEIREAIESYVPDNQRSQVEERGSTTLILDAYNANPTSMELALRQALTGSKGRVGLVLGDMLELGTHAEAEHQALGKLIRKLGPSVFVGVGPLMEHAVAEVKRSWLVKTLGYPDVDAVLADFPPALRKCQVVLIKGSNSLGLHRLAEAWEA